jgi:dCTP deaminase
LFRDTALRRLHAETPLVEEPAGGAPNAAVPREVIRNGLAFTVDVSGGVSGQRGSGIVGYKARRHTDVIDVDLVDHYDPREFWEPVYPHRTPRGPEGVVLDPNDFYVLASREAVVVPPDHAAEMIPYDAFVGEFRVHYAGFFDPGFGSAEADGSGSRAVLEVRSHEVPFLVEHGQIVGRLIYEPLIARPDKLYGGAIGSSYQRQGLALSKHFKKVAWG